MGHAALLLRLEGPLQAWGLRSRWDIRDSGTEPSKSAIIGLLGCALGYRRGDPRLEDLDKTLALAVRVDQEGRPLVDFHTVTGLLPRADGQMKGRPEEPATIVSERTYLQDASYLVVLTGPRGVLGSCADALEHPRWPLYLGRKSCPPSRPIFLGLEEGPRSAEDILREYPAERSAPGGESVRLRCVLEDPQGEGERADALRANPARMYGGRRVRTLWVEVPLPIGGA